MTNTFANILFLYHCLRDNKLEIKELRSCFGIRNATYYAFRINSTDLKVYRLKNTACGKSWSYLTCLAWCGMSLVILIRCNVRPGGLSICYMYVSRSYFIRGLVTDRSTSLNVLISRTVLLQVVLCNKGLDGFPLHGSLMVII